MGNFVNNERTAFLRHCADAAKVDSIFKVPENVVAYTAQRVLHMLAFELSLYEDREEGIRAVLKILKLPNRGSTHGEEIKNCGRVFKGWNNARHNLDYEEGDIGYL